MIPIGWTKKQKFSSQLSLPFARKWIILLWNKRNENSSKFNEIKNNLLFKNQGESKTSESREKTFNGMRKYT